LSPFLDRLFEQVDEEGRSMSDEEAAGEFAMFFIAGFETISNTLAWCLYLLCSNPTYQQSLYDDIKHLFNSPTLENFNQCQPLLKLMRETLRLFPVAFICSRSTAEDMTICDLPVAKDTEVFLDLYTAYRNADVFPNAESFNPDRFDDPEQVKHFAAFGGGPRICPGLKFAELEFKVTMTKLLKAFKFSMEPITTVEEYTFFIALAPRSFKILATPR